MIQDFSNRVETKSPIKAMIARLEKRRPLFSPQRSQWPMLCSALPVLIFSCWLKEFGKINAYEFVPYLLRR